MSVPRGYVDYVIQQARLDNSLQGLTKFIQDPNGEQQYQVNIVCIDFAQGQPHTPQQWRIEPRDGYHTYPGYIHTTLPSRSDQNQRSHEHMRQRIMMQMTTIPENIEGRIILVEDIDRHVVAHLGTQYNLPLSFLATYLTTELSNSPAHEPEPPLMTLAPSKSISDHCMHLHYQRVIDLGIGKQRKKLYSRSNVRRTLKPTPLLDERCPGLARSCCSLYLCHDENDKWICIILVDATTAEPKRPDTVRFSPVKTKSPRNISEQAAKISDFWAWERAEKLHHEKGPFSSSDPDPQTPNSLLHTLSRLFSDAQSIGQIENPSLLSFAYFPTQLVIAEWMRYALLLSRYVKHYEYALVSSNVSLKQSKVKELLPWRRRCVRSGHKLDFLRRSIKHHFFTAQTSEVQDRWRPILEDIDHVSSQIAEWATFLNSMVPMMDSHQSLVEAQSVRHLTYVVLVFSSLGLVASIFSMSEKVLPWGGGNVWLYFAVSVPFTVLVLCLYFLFSSVLGRLFKV